LPSNPEWYLSFQDKLVTTTSWIGTQAYGTLLTVIRSSRSKTSSKHPTNNWWERKEKETMRANEKHATVLITKNTCCLHFARQDKKSDPLWMLFESHKVALSFEHIIGA